MFFTTFLTNANSVEQYKFTNNNDQDLQGFEDEYYFYYFDNDQDLQGFEDEYYYFEDDEYVKEYEKEHISEIKSKNIQVQEIINEKIDLVNKEYSNKRER